MAVIGTDDITSLSRQYVVPKIVDAVYTSNPFFFRLHQAGKIVPGGTQAEMPFLYAAPTNGGSYTGYDVLNIDPSENVKNGVWEWKQYYQPVTIDGLTMIKSDSPEAVANLLNVKFKIARMAMADNLGTDALRYDSADATKLDSVQRANDDGTVASSYAGLTRSSNTWLNATEDSATATLTLDKMQTLYGNVSEGGHEPTLILSRQEQYNRYWNMLTPIQRHNQASDADLNRAGGAGFSNLTFNAATWCVDSHVADGANSSNSRIEFLTEDFWVLETYKGRNFYLEPFQSGIVQDAYVSKLLWAGRLRCENPARNGNFSAITA